MAIDMATDMMVEMTKSSAEKFTLTDLHTHILPAVDDGADSLEEALDMLRKQKGSGIERVCLTPHFYPMHEELDTFLARRQQAYTALISCWEEDTMPQLRLGAEVRYSPALLQMDLKRLTIGDSNYLLLELPDIGVPAYIEQVLEKILSQQITPILAHVERCRFLRENPARLLGLVQMGAVAQISADCLTGRTGNFAIACLKNGLAHIISSDIHSLKGRNCCLGTIATGKYTELIRWTESFARAVWDNAPLPAFTVKPIKNGLLGYRFT